MKVYSSRPRPRKNIAEFIADLWVSEYEYEDEDEDESNTHRVTRNTQRETPHPVPSRFSEIGSKKINYKQIKAACECSLWHYRDFLCD